MGLLDDIKQEAELKPGPSCAAGKLLADPEVGPDLQQAFDEGLPFEAMSRALYDAGKRVNGKRVSGTTLSRHATHRCGCHRG